MIPISLSETRSKLNGWENDFGNGTSWDAARRVSDLSKREKQHELAIDFGYRALKAWPGDGALSSALAWAMYRKDLSDLSVEENSLIQRRKARDSLAKIKQLCSENPYGKYSPWPKAVLKLSSILLERWPNEALDLLRQLNRSKLSDEKTGDFQSERERWFMMSTKALEGSDNWESLSRVCDASKSEGCISSENQKWIRLREAEAWRHLGRAVEAESVIAAEAKSSRVTWLYERWAKVLTEVGRDREALDVAYQALASGGATAKGWKTLLLVGNLLQKSDPSLASDHLKLSILLREREGWPMNRSLQELEARLSDYDTNDSLNSLMAKLKSVWRKVEDDNRETGTVLKHLNDGAGFIQPDSGDGALFFSVPKHSQKPLPDIGVQVSFVRTKAFDKKKNQDCERAVKWRVVN